MCVDASVASFAWRGGGYPICTSIHPRGRRQRGGGFGRYLYVHNIRATYVGHQVMRSKAGLHPSPSGRTPAGGALGALLLRPQVGVQCRRLEAVGGGYCYTSETWACLTVARSEATVPTWNSLLGCSSAMRRPVATVNICLCAASAYACHAYAPAKRNRVGTPPPPPSPTLSAVGLTASRSTVVWEPSPPSPAAPPAPRFSLWW